MDPNASLRTLELCVQERDFDTAEEYCDYLDRWIAAGGFEPTWDNHPDGAAYFNSWQRRNR